jgi:hypothetical protein
MNLNLKAKIKTVKKDANVYLCVMNCFASHFNLIEYKPTVYLISKLLL